MKNKNLLGNLLLILTAIIWGTAFVSQRVGMESIEPMTFNAARYGLGTVAVSLVALISSAKKRSLPDPRTPDERKKAQRCTLFGGLGCGFFLAVGGFFQQAGLVYSTAGKAGFITAQYMLLVPIANFLLFKKKNTLQVWLAVLIGVVGMYLLCVTEDFGLAYSDLLREFAESTPNCHFFNPIAHTPLHDPEIFVEDGIHYNQKGYDVFADYFREILKDELAKF